jgi:predicted DNA-binding transcriptional regulator YafY
MGMFAFDRIQKLELTNVKFEIDPDFDAAEYFADCFGVFVHDGTEIEKVVIRAFDPQPYYLRDVPLHHSQKEMTEEDGSVYFEYRLRPTKDFCNHLLSLGNTIKVISPEWLAEEIRNMHLEAASLYD